MGEGANYFTKTDKYEFEQIAAKSFGSKIITAKSLEGGQISLLKQTSTNFSRGKIPRLFYIKTSQKGKILQLSFSRGKIPRLFN